MTKKINDNTIEQISKQITSYKNKYVPYFHIDKINEMIIDFCNKHHIKFTKYDEVREKHFLNFLKFLNEESLFLKFIIEYFNTFYRTSKIEKYGLCTYINKIIQNYNFKIQFNDSKEYQLFDTKANRILSFNDEIFILMDFDKSQTNKFDAINKIFENNNLKCIRIDKFYVKGLITEKIWEKIETAKFCIFDISTLNANVMLELGYALKTRIEMLIICDHKMLLPFNISNYQVHFFSDAKELENIVTGFINNQKC